MTVRDHTNTPACDVFVNGSLIKHVLMFDIERGKCVVARQPITVAHAISGPRILRHTLYGIVTFRLLK